ncbi:MAG: S-layer homology domain-containing protein [Lachnospiraceae bacterium]|nr:S-layer homology domain-containing protein [Lachnospiraceae bacterium]
MYRKVQKKDKTVRFFYTNVYNDMFADVIGHEWYAGAVECAWQNGIIDGHLVENGCFHPEKEVTLEEFFSFAVNGYKSRKELPGRIPVFMMKNALAMHSLMSGRRMRWGCWIKMGTKICSACLPEARRPSCAGG